MSFPDIRKSRKWLSPQEIRILVLALILLIVLLAGNITLARILPGGEWFFLRWSGARAFLIEKIQPYGTEIAQQTQEVAYGRPGFSSEYGYVLNDPFYLVLLYTPLAFIQDFNLVRGIWMLLSEFALVGIVLFAFNLSEWQPPRAVHRSSNLWLVQLFQRERAGDRYASHYVDISLFMDPGGVTLPFG